MEREKLKRFDPDGQFETEILGKGHDREPFNSGNENLDRYLKQTARQDMKRGLAIPYVLVAKDAPQKILGFYTLSNESIEFNSLPDYFSKKLPSHRKIPATLIGQLAVDQSVQGKGVGRKLLIDAIGAAKTVSQSIASYAVVVDAINEEVEKFYIKAGFSPMNNQEHRLFFRL